MTVKRILYELNEIIRASDPGTGPTLEAIKRLADKIERGDKK